MRSAIKKMRLMIEAILAYVTYGVLRSLPLDIASGFGGWVARNLGPHTKVHRVAVHNLAKAMPQLSAQQQQKILIQMWDNLGRVFAEYPHLNSAVLHKRITLISGQEHLKFVQQNDRPVLFISAHLGNWEVTPLAAALSGLPIHLLYRPANNKIIDRLVKNIRKPYSLGLHAKGNQSARTVIHAMRKKEPVAMLVDQKSNDGVAANFFGMDAMTSTAVAHFVMKFDAIIIPAYCIRTHGVHFEMRAQAPMQFNLAGDYRADIKMIMQAVNDHIETWIRQDPAQWFWVHKRWPHSKI